MGDVVKLQPASVELPDRKAPYMPRLPWRGIFLASSICLIIFGTLTYRERQKIATLKAVIVKVRQEKLRNAVNRYEHIASQSDRAIIEALRRSKATDWQDDRTKGLSLQDLQKSGIGLYARVSVNRQKTLLGEDAISRCLGIGTRSLHDMLKQGDFLSAEWLRRAQNANTLIRLRVLDHELSNRIKRDLPLVAPALNSPWLMLSVEHQATREHGPVDIYIWDLVSQRMVFAQRTMPEGSLISVKIPANLRSANTSATATVQASSALDCSIANQVQSSLGRPGPT